MGRSRCRRGRQYGDEWQRQHGGGKLKPQFNGATISFVFLKYQKKHLFLIFFSKNLPPLKSAALGGRLMVKSPLTKGSPHVIMVASYFTQIAQGVFERRPETTKFSGVVPCRLPLNNWKLDCGAVSYGRATDDSADAAQVGRVNVARGFRNSDRPRSFKSSNLRNDQRDSATKLSPGGLFVTVDLPVYFSVDSFDGPFLANFRKLP
jgi:hypothetical protein